MKTYHQCRLRRGTTETTAWIEARGAKEGADIELLPDHETWRVTNVYGDGIPENLLKTHQQLNRGSLPSVERTDA